jgi:hypothetical protein
MRMITVSLAASVTFLSSVALAQTAETIAAPPAVRRRPKSEVPRFPRLTRG